MIKLVKHGITILAGGRKRKLYRQKPGGVLYVRFSVRGKDCERSTGTPIEAAAKERGKQIVEAELYGDLDKSRELKMRSDYSTLREVTDIYVGQFGTDARRKRTALGNTGSLEKIVRVALSQTLDQARTNVLTADLIRKFEATQEKLIVRDHRGFMDHKSTLRVRSSTRSWVKQAKSIFKKNTMSWFESLALPDLTSFREQGVRSPEREKPQRLDENVIKALNAAAPALAQENPACYIAFLLFSRLGLRNSEIKFARMVWIHRDPVTGTGKLAIIKRPEENFLPKGSSRTLTLGAGLLAEIDSHWLPSPDADFIIPARNKTERANIVDKQHSKWAGQWIRDRSKTSYELRRWAGSVVLRKTGSIYAAKEFLGHSSVGTTETYYAYLIDEMPAVDLEDFAL